MRSQKYTESDHNEEQRKINLDTILIEDIGQFGMYQFRILVLTCIMVIFIAFSAMEFIFSTARINTRCLIPECEGTEAADFSPAWIANAIPTSDSSNASCLRYASTNATARISTCPAEWFNREVTISCSDHVYENTDTLVYHFGLACDEWRRTIIGSVLTVGGFISLPTTGFISDHWGRRFALSWNAVNIAWIGIVRYWVNNYYGFLAVELVKAALGAGGFSCAYILVMELVGPKYRVPAGATINTTFSIGQVLLGLIAWAVPNWKNLILTLYVPQLMFISYFWIMSESVRWYMSKGRYEKAEEFLKNVARVNKRDLSEKSLRALKESAELEKVLKASAGEIKAKELWLIVLVFRHKEILKRCCVAPIWWIASALIYYGLSINAVNMSGNQYINFVAVAASEIPGYWLAVLLMDRVGRKPVLIGAYWTCAACQLAYIFIPSNLYGASLTVYLVGKLSIAVVMVALYIYTSEIFPTKYRHCLFAFSSMIGRIGAIVAPITPALGAAIWHHFPSALFCGFALLAGALVFLAPETLGTKLPDTMEEASEIGAKNNAH
ncbi:organic cation transporter protein-like [Pararge aegeria]|uniref:Jg15625 protein n=1 Tax=Pararge aegeria aegeria TaxID=348720 RepID=A0A8S4RVH6_9NEOP|nr:organic cation transporter protein-like [Pararge aegeria]CAH2241428.1 jg15625 [Pararge aegeria aegeria]